MNLVTTIPTDVIMRYTMANSDISLFVLFTEPMAAQTESMGRKDVLPGVIFQ